jgi:hypothetical protein
VGGLVRRKNIEKEKEKRIQGKTKGYIVCKK